MSSIIDRAVRFCTYHGGSELSQPSGALIKWGAKAFIGGIGVACVTDCALRALGASTAVEIGFVVIPASIGIVGAGALVIGSVALGVLLCFALKWAN